MLIFALARSGDVKAAKIEFDKLAALARPHSLTPTLRAFLLRAEADQKASEPAEADAGVDVSEAIRFGSEARKKGLYADAEKIFQEALQKKPGDPELLTALAEVTRARSNLVEAAKLFDQALGKERTFVPALAGLADLKWELGDRTAAIALYKQVLEKGGNNSPFAAKAKERIHKRADPVDEEGRVPDDYVAPENLVGKPPPAPNAPPANPDIDTSDLPGNKP